MSGISIQKLYPDGMVERVALGDEAYDAEDVSSLTKISAIHALLEMAYDGTLRRNGFLDVSGPEAVRQFMEIERAKLRTIAGESRNDAVYALAYKYGGPLGDIEGELEDDGDVPLTKLIAMADSDDPYGVTGADPDTARIARLADRMNRIAQNAGATNTVFVTPHGHTGGWDVNNWRILGWPEPDDLEGDARATLMKHHSSADDMSLITARFLAEFPEEFADIFTHRGTRHTLRSVLNAPVNFATSEEGARWVALGGKSGTGYGFWSNGEQLENPDRHPSAGRFHGQTVFKEIDARGEDTGHYMIITVSGFGRNRGDRGRRNTNMRGLQASQWRSNGAIMVNPDERERVSVASNRSEDWLEEAVIPFVVEGSYEVCDVESPGSPTTTYAPELRTPLELQREPC